MHEACLHRVLLLSVKLTYIPAIVNQVLLVHLLHNSGAVIRSIVWNGRHLHNLATFEVAHVAGSLEPPLRDVGTDLDTRILEVGHLPPVVHANAALDVARTAELRPDL